MLPNKNNLCSGIYPDWLDVCLIDKCNGRCNWCVGKTFNYRPLKRVNWDILSERIINYGKSNVVLVGGEPTLYKDIDKLINKLNDNKIKVHITTNGSMLTDKYVKDNLLNINTINISIHHYDMIKNHDITGLNINIDVLKNSILELKKIPNITIRLTCNIIKGYIDNIIDIYKYIEFAKNINATDVRFSEIQYNEDIFVDLAKLFDYKYGLNDEPYTNGCCFDTVINNMPVRLKQVCGCLSEHREFPINPQKSGNKVLYYDGEFYDAWQKLPYISDFYKKIMDDVASGKLSIDECFEILKEE